MKILGVLSRHGLRLGRSIALRRAGQDHQYRPRLFLRRALCRQAGEDLREIRARARHLLRAGRRAGAAGDADQAGRCRHPQLRARADRRGAGQAHRGVLLCRQPPGEQRHRATKALAGRREAQRRGQGEAPEGHARRDAVRQRLGREDARRAGEEIQPDAAGRHQERLSRRRGARLCGGVPARSGRRRAAVRAGRRAGAAGRQGQDLSST